MDSIRIRSASEAAVPAVNSSVIALVNNAAKPNATPDIIAAAAPLALSRATAIGAPGDPA